MNSLLTIPGVVLDFRHEAPLALPRGYSIGHSAQVKGLGRPLLGRGGAAGWDCTLGRPAPHIEGVGAS